MSTFSFITLIINKKVHILLEHQTKTTPIRITQSASSKYSTVMRRSFSQLDNIKKDIWKLKVTRSNITKKVGKTKTELMKGELFQRTTKRMDGKGTSYIKKQSSVKSKNTKWSFVQEIWHWRTNQNAMSRNREMKGWYL